MKYQNRIVDSGNGPAITRKYAIEIGAIIDLLEPETRDVVLRMDFPFPVTITYPAYCEAIYCSSRKKSADNDVSPGLFEVLQAFRSAICLGNPRERTRFEVSSPHLGLPAIKFKSVCELDDNGAPVLTITTLEESDTLNPKGRIGSQNLLA